MTEGKLYANINYSNYMLGSIDGPDISEGQAIEVLLGGHWIPGHVGYSHAGSLEETAQRVGSYQIPDEDVPDSVTLASEESFPASDPSALNEDKPIARVVGGYYFQADADGSVCGLCIGIHVRIQ
ncbi:MAG: hypothetical protein H0U76_13305 [Ktedonobacteraceae bacterium]|nr:hypothetical protein [Ktedonobacteraceae bacterium]